MRSPIILLLFGSLVFGSLVGCSSSPGTIRMGMRCMTRLTNAFSKKWENLRAAYARWFAFFNFCRVHKTLRCTPAMEAGIADHIWSVRELLETN
jgi:hypothetical protein